MVQETVREHFANRVKSKGIIKVKRDREENGGNERNMESVEHLIIMDQAGHFLNYKNDRLHLVLHLFCFFTSLYLFHKLFNTK